MDMKTAPSRLGYFLIAITIARVAILLDDGLTLGWMGWFFALALGAGVYVSAFYFGRATGWRKLPGALGLALFGAADLWFNEVEIIRTISATQLVVESANFMGLSAEDLRWVMHISALIFGAFPTVGAALLGWMQSVAPSIDEFNQPGFLSRITKAAADVIAARAQAVEARLTQTAVPALPVGEEVPKNGTGKLATRWRNLNQEDCIWIDGHSRPEVSRKYGISDGAAGEWQRRIRAGEKPWLPNVQIIDQQ